MPVVLLLLSIPLLSGLALALDHYTRTAATRDEMAFLSLLMRVMALALAGVGAACVASMILLGLPNVYEANDVVNGIVRILISIYSLAAVAAGVVAEWCARGSRQSLVSQEARFERNRAIFRLLCWILVWSPFTLFAWWFTTIALIIFAAVLTAWSALTRGHEAALLWRLAIVAETGMPLMEEVEFAAEAARGRRRVALFSLASQLRDGRSLADSLEVGERLLPRSAILAIRAAENSPVLPEVLRAAARLSVRELAAIGSPGNLLPFHAYAINLFTIILAIIGFLMYWIVPKIAAILTDSGVEFPPVTRALVSTANAMASMPWLLAPVVLTVMLFMIPSIVSLLGWSNLNWPLLMRWFPHRDGPMILRAIAAGIESRRPLPEVAADLAEHCRREDLRTRLERVAGRLGEGRDLGEALSREGFVRRVDAQALQTAAIGAHLPLVMQSLADVLESRQRIRERWLMELQRPVLMVSMALLVGFICVGMFTPLVEILEKFASETAV